MKSSRRLTQVTKEEAFTIFYPAVAADSELSPPDWKSVRQPIVRLLPAIRRHPAWWTLDPSAVAEGRSLSTADMKTLRRPIYGLLARVKGLYITGATVWFLYCYFSLLSTIGVSTITLSCHSLEGVKVSLLLYQLPGGRSEISNRHRLACFAGLPGRSFSPLHLNY